MAIACRHDERAKQGYAFLTYVRDVVWQDDLFGRLRKRARAAGRTRSPSFLPSRPSTVACERSRGSMGVQQQNACRQPSRPVFLTCQLHVRAQRAAPSESLPSSGWAALEAYVLAMRPHVLLVTWNLTACKGPFDFGWFHFVPSPAQNDEMKGQSLCHQTSPCSVSCVDKFAPRGWAILSSAVTCFSTCSWDGVGRWAGIAGMGLFLGRLQEGMSRHRCIRTAMGSQHICCCGLPR